MGGNLSRYYNGHGYCVFVTYDSNYVIYHRRMYTRVSWR